MLSEIQPGQFGQLNLGVPFPQYPYSNRRKCFVPQPGQMHSNTGASQCLYCFNDMGLLTYFFFLNYIRSSDDMASHMRFARSLRYALMHLGSLHDTEVCHDVRYLFPQYWQVFSAFSFRGGLVLPRSRQSLRCASLEHSPWW